MTPVGATALAVSLSGGACPPHRVIPRPGRAVPASTPMSAGPRNLLGPPGGLGAQRREYRRSSGHRYGAAAVAVRLPRRASWRPWSDPSALRSPAWTGVAVRPGLRMTPVGATALAVSLSGGACPPHRVIPRPGRAGPCVSRVSAGPRDLLGPPGGLGAAASRIPTQQRPSVRSSRGCRAASATGLVAAVGRSFGPAKSTWTQGAVRPGLRMTPVGRVSRHPLKMTPSRSRLLDSL
jgi:hypothetical protein